jgi:hypothetical protein
MTYLDAGIMNPTQSEQFKANLKKSRGMVPWSVKDVANFKIASEKNDKLTFQDFMKSKGEKLSETKPSEKKPQPTQTDRDLAKTNPALAAKFEAHFGEKP